MSGNRIAYVVDDEATVRRSLKLLLRSADFTVRDFESGDAFLHAATMETLAFGCVLLDLRMPGIDGLAVQREMIAQGMKLPVVIVTAHGDIQLAVQAIKAGACDFVEKPYDTETILQAVEAALIRGDEEWARARDADEAALRVAALAPREVEVLQGLVAGRQNKMIAFDLSLSVRTVEVYRASLMAKLNARSLSEAVRIALSAGLGTMNGDR